MKNIAYPIFKCHTYSDKSNRVVVNCARVFVSWRPFQTTRPVRPTHLRSQIRPLSKNRASCPFFFLCYFLLFSESSSAWESSHWSQL